MRERRGRRRRRTRAAVARDDAIGCGVQDALYSGGEAQGRHATVWMEQQGQITCERAMFVHEEELVHAGCGWRGGSPGRCAAGEIRAMTWAAVGGRPRSRWAQHAGSRAHLHSVCSGRKDRGRRSRRARNGEAGVCMLWAEAVAVVWLRTLKARMMD